MGVRIDCCKDCVPPKRHPACHDTCEEYKKQKAEWDKTKEKIKSYNKYAVKITPYDYDEINYARYKGHKRKTRG